MQRVASSAVASESGDIEESIEIDEDLDDLGDDSDLEISGSGHLGGGEHSGGGGGVHGVSQSRVSMDMGDSLYGKGGRLFYFFNYIHVRIFKKTPSVSRHFS